MPDLLAIRGRVEVIWLYKGTLIQDIVALVERVQNPTPSRKANGDALLSRSCQSQGFPQSHARSFSAHIAISEAEQFPQALRLSPADWNLALLLIIHAQLIRAFEPRDDFANSIDIHQIGTVRPPEQARVQAGQ